jgi:hypothetical protein
LPEHKPLIKKKQKKNRFMSKLAIKYEDTDNAIKLTANTLQTLGGKFKNPIGDRRQNKLREDDDFDSLFG